MTAPISIIVPVLNRAALIGRAIQSVIDEGQDEVEIIVIDGGSSDGTRDVARSFPGVQVIEAPGSSIWEAVNIGIRQANGIIIGHLNSDDRLCPGTLTEIRAAEAEAPAAAIIRGRARFVAADASGGLRRLPAFEAAVAEQLDLAALIVGPTANNACFVRAEAYRRLGPYDETLRISADREWLLRAVLAGASVHQIDSPVYEYLVHDASMTTTPGLPNRKVYVAYIHEHLAIAERYLPSATGRTRRLLQAWHAQEMLRLVSCGWSTPDFTAQIAHAFQLSPAWPIWSFGPLAKLVIRRIRRRFMIG
jgi:glycosyltransferase involved in cell wall biosynthesis